MSDFRDPRDPIRRDPIYDGLNEPALNQMRSQAVGPGIALAWFFGLVLFIGVLIFAFGGEDNPRVASTQTGMPAPAGETRSGPEPAPSTTPPANTPAPKVTPGQ